VSWSSSPLSATTTVSAPGRTETEKRCPSASPFP
jgi:hypothetical protein